MIIANGSYRNRKTQQGDHLIIDRVVVLFCLFLWFARFEEALTRNDLRYHRKEHKERFEI